MSVKSTINFTRLIKEPTKYAELLDLADLEELLVKLKEQYYTTDQPLVPDFIYDEIEDVLRIRKPTSKVLALTDTDVVKGKSVILPYYMHSQRKAKADSGDMERWLAKYTGPYVVSHKIDGMSILMVYDKSIRSDSKMRLYTRGQKGHEGYDVTRHAKNLDLGKMQ